MFPPHLLRTSNLSRTLAQPRSKQQSTPQSLPSVSLFPYRTTKSRHWVLYALIKQDEAPATERLLLFKRSNVPSGALDWANKYIQKVFAARIEEQELPDKSFTDVSVFLSAVALTAGVDFKTMTSVAEQAVSGLATFFQSLLDANARSQMSDVHLLSTRNDSIRVFLQSWLAPYIPNATAFLSRDLSQEAVSAQKDNKVTPTSTSLQTTPRFLPMDVQLSQSRPCGWLDFGQVKQPHMGAVGYSLP